MFRKISVQSPNSSELCPQAPVLNSNSDPMSLPGLFLAFEVLASFKNNRFLKFCTLYFSKAVI